MRTMRDQSQAESKQYGLDNLTITTYRQADQQTKSAFEALVLSLTPDQDDENGPDTWQWVLGNNAIFPAGGPYDTLLFCDSDTGEVLATGTFTPDDRDALKDNNITAFGVVGFVNVLRRDLRGVGLGTFICDYLDDHIQTQVNRTGSPQDVYLFTESPGYYASRMLLAI